MQSYLYEENTKNLDVQEMNEQELLMVDGGIDFKDVLKIAEAKIGPYLVIDVACRISRQYSATEIITYGLTEVATLIGKAVKNWYEMPNGYPSTSISDYLSDFRMHNCGAL